MDVIGVQLQVLWRRNIFIIVQSVKSIYLIGSNSSFVESAVRHLTQLH